MNDKNLKSSSHSPSVIHLDHDQPIHKENSTPGSNTKVITLGETIDSIIKKDLGNSNLAAGSSFQVPSNHRSMPQIYPHHSYPYHLISSAPPSSQPSEVNAAAEHQNWKLRRALQHKDMEALRERERERERERDRTNSSGNSLQSDERQIIRIAQPQSPRSKCGGVPTYSMEPVSPPETSSGAHHWIHTGGANTAESVGFLPSRRYFPESGGSKPSHISPLEYVNNKIVEVMRTSEDDKSEQVSVPQQQRHLQQLPQQHLNQQQQTFSGGKSGNGVDENGGFPSDVKDCRLNEVIVNQLQDTDCNSSVMEKERQEAGRCDSPKETENEDGGMQQLGGEGGMQIDTVLKVSSGLECAVSRVTNSFPKTSPLLVNNPISSTFSIAPITSVVSCVAPSFGTSPSTYTYPFSALTVPSAGHSPTSIPIASTKLPVSCVSNTVSMQLPQQNKLSSSGQSQLSLAVSSNQPVDMPSRSSEPAPLLCAQYEPLSDED
ncbi:hypothetical protein PR048_012613 [Dryococelus australis]|uniref:Uncharacterized protein n=1 Tax=Dryococelus australis TaxID=614101 RepID=A0ABQ9HQ98_9NEOP|nr:hypothetical protein PR048_012613 [Dryococelus australis]